MVGFLKDAGDLSLFHDLPRVHDSHPVGHLRNHAQVVGDEDDSGIEAGPQFPQQIQDLCLDSHVQCRGGFVCDEEPGPQGQRHGNHHPLGLASREFVGVGVGLLGRVGDAHQPQQFHGPFPGFFLFHALVHLEDLGNLVADGVHRIETAFGLLENHGDAVPSNAGHIHFGEGQEVDAIKPDFPVHDAARRVHQTHDGEGSHAFTAP